MSDDRDFDRVCEKAAEQGYEFRQLTKGVYTLRQRVRQTLLTRIMRWQIGKLRAFGKLEQVEAWLDGDRNSSKN